VTYAGRLHATRSALVSASRALLAQGGIKALSMSAVATQSRLARATVYNHVRDRDELLTLAAHSMVTDLASIAAARNNARAGLTACAEFLATDPAIATLRKVNPEFVAEGVNRVLSLEEPVAVAVMDIMTAWKIHADLSLAETALRWLASHAIAPGTPAEREVGADIMTQVLVLDRNRL